MGIHKALHCIAINIIILITGCLLMTFLSSTAMAILSPEEKARAIGHLEAGAKGTDVAKMFGCSRRTIYNLKRNFIVRGTVRRKSGSGRPTSVAQDIKNRIVAMHEAEPFRTAVETSQELNVGRNVIRRILKSAGLKARSPAKKPKLTVKHRDDRRLWCTQHLRWTAQDWGSVLFSDESSFNVSHGDARSVVYRRTNQRYNQDMIVETTNKGYGNVMVWGGIIGDRKTQLVRVVGRLTADSYIRDILTDHVVPVCGNRLNEFRQDNAPPHKAHVTRAFLENENVTTISWPAVSPDMNPIEHVWAFMKKELRKRDTCRDSDHLFDTLVAIWEGISPDFILKLTSSMRRRLQAVLNVNGGHSKY